MPEDGRWRPLAVHGPADLPGSVTDFVHERLSVVLFSCMGPSSVVSRATGGEFIKDSASMAAVLLTGKMMTLAQIGHGQSFDLEMMTPRRTVYVARWTHYENYDTDEWRQHHG
jgi:hypothetical protein